MRFITAPREAGEAEVARLMWQVNYRGVSPVTIHTQRTKLDVSVFKYHSRWHYLHTWRVSRTVFTCCPMSQLASALAHVHECGIAHLDIKPANVLLAADGSIRLADFGIAARVPALRHRGTPLFAAPEVSDRLHVRWSVYIRVCTCSVFDVVSISGAYWSD